MRSVSAAEDVPQAVRAALRSRTRTKAAQSGSRQPAIARGDLRVVEDQGADRRIGLVTHLNASDVFDTADGFAEILLVHSAPELATDHDVILPAEITNAPYTTVVQTDIAGVVWIRQLGERVGWLTPTDFAEIRKIDDSFTGNRPDTRFCTGTRLAGLRDGRWRFKQTEGDALRALVADCTYTLLCLLD